MDKIILGLLMLNRLTIYELRKVINLNFKSMCSDSLGSIQNAINKLLEANMITVHEFVEKSVNKKRYSITDVGRAAFLAWIKTPMDMDKAKNMELSKLLFMGLAPKTERVALLSEVIAALQEQLAYLEKIQESAGNTDESIKQFVAYIEQDTEYLAGLKNATGNSDVFENAQGIAQFQKITLQFGVDTTKFQIEWFASIKRKLEQGEAF